MNVSHVPVVVFHHRVTEVGGFYHESIAILELVRKPEDVISKSSGPNVAPKVVKRERRRWRISWRVLQHRFGRRNAENVGRAEISELRTKLVEDVDEQSLTTFQDNRDYVCGHLMQIVQNFGCAGIACLRWQRYAIWTSSRCRFP